MKKILIIEDNKDVRENLEEILELAGYTVLSAKNGKEGVLLTKSDKPELVICDIMMPGLDGYGVLYMLMQDPATADIPFIFLTAKSEKSDIRKGMSMGADDYITKPFNGTELLSAIEGRLKRSALMKKEFPRTMEGLNSFFDTAKSLNELAKLSADKKARPVKKKEIIFMQDDEAENMVFIIKGKVKTSKMNKEGKEIITGLFNKGDFIGTLDLLENKRHKDTATAMENCEIAYIPKNEIYTLLYSNRDIAIQFIHMLSNNKDEIEERLLAVAFNSVRKRVAESLLSIHKKYSTGGSTDVLPISRTDLAGIVGIAPETLSRTLADFKKEKIIDFKDRFIAILKPGALENMNN